jgi:hypothetical protein
VQFWKKTFTWVAVFHRNFRMEWRERKEEVAPSESGWRLNHVERQPPHLNC